MFEFTTGLKNTHSPQAILPGPFVQGSSTDRFIYIDIGTCAGQSNTFWSRTQKSTLCGNYTEYDQKDDGRY